MRWMVRTKQRPTASSKALRSLLLLGAGLCATTFTARTASASDPSRTVLVQPAQVSLVGTLKSRTYYAAPGSGDDRREQFLVLQLDEPIRVVSQGGSLLDEASEFEVASDKPARLEKLLGDRVALQGSLFLGHQGKHHTRVVLRANAVEPLDD
jgi:Domain of unknown function (DUF4431)